MKHYKIPSKESLEGVFGEYFKHLNAQYVYDISLIKDGEKYSWYGVDLNGFHKKVDPADYSFTGDFYYGSPVMKHRHPEVFNFKR